MASIFDRVRLTPQQMRTVADRRSDDAHYLRRSRQNKHANGVYYLGGFVLECRLKTAVLERYPWLQHPSGQQTWSRADRELYNLCYRQHDLEGLLAFLPGLLRQFWEVDPSGGLYHNLLSLCGQWTIFARYSPQMTTMQQAAEFLDQIRELKRWVR
jgi:hypothetical protein